MIFTLALAGCVELRDVELVGLDLVEGARSMIVVIAEEGGPSSRVIAVSSPDQLRDPMLFQFPSGDFDLTARYFGCGLETLRLEPGVQQLSASLPPSRSIFRSRVEGGSQSDWTRMPAEMLPAPEWCFAFEVDFGSTRLFLPARDLDDAAFGLVLDESRDLIVTETGEFFLVAADATVERLEIPPSTPHFAGVSFGDELWLSGLDESACTVTGTRTVCNTALAVADRRDPRAGFRPVSSSALIQGSSYGWIDGARVLDRLELFVLADDHTLASFDGSEWKILDRVLDKTVLCPGEEDDLSPNNGVVRAGEGEAIVQGSRCTSLLRYRRGTVTEETLGAGAIRSIAALPRYGVVAGTTEGELYAEAGGGWRRFTSATDERNIRVIAALEEGIIFGGENGTFAQYFPLVGVCPARGLGSGSDARDLIPLGDNYLVVADAKSNEDTVLTLLTPKIDPRPRCDLPEVED